MDTWKKPKAIKQKKKQQKDENWVGHSNIWYRMLKHLALLNLENPSKIKKFLLIL